MADGEPKRAFLTSAPVACGIGWLVNALTAAEFKTISLNHPNGGWELLPDQSYKMPAKAREHLGNHMPILFERSQFHFTKGVEIFWEHRVNFTIASTAPVVLLIRDPRDAIYSLFRRWKSKGWIEGEFGDFLRRPSDWPDHFPGLFSSNPIQTYFYFNFAWLKAARFRKLKMIRFEELKAKPLATLQETIAFLGLQAPSSATLAAAVASSDVKTARELIDRGTAGDNFSAVHKGLVEEWKETYRPEWLAHFQSPEICAALRLLGYSAPASAYEKPMRALIEGKCASLGTALMFRLMDVLRVLYPEKMLKKLNPDGLERMDLPPSWRAYLKRWVVAAYWGERCASDAHQVLEMRACFVGVF